MRYYWMNVLWATVFIGCSTFSGDSSTGDSNTSNPPTSEGDAGSTDGGMVSAPACGNTVCDAPPEATCVDDRSYQSFAASCVEGACQYDPKPVACPDATSCVEGACIDTRARLSALEVSPGKLSFDPAKMQYTVTVPVDTPSVEIKASVSDANHSSISIDGGAGASVPTITSSAAFVAGSKVRQVPIRVDTTYGTSTTYSVLFLYQGEHAALVPFGKTTYVGFSTAISMDGSTILVGMPDFLGKQGSSAVCRRSVAGIWKEAALLSNEMGGYYANSVALSGDGKLAAVGMRCDMSSSSGINGAEVTTDMLSCSGSVRIYRQDGGSWKQEAYVKAATAHPNDSFGAAVALSEDATTLVVGADGDAQNAKGIDGVSSGATLSNSGAAYIFHRTSSGTWTQEAYLKASSPNENDHFGISVAISNSGIVAVGAHGDAKGGSGSENDNSLPGSGAVYAFRRESDGKWKQQSYIKASNADVSDRFGFRVVLSADGATLAASAMGEASNSVGVGGDEGNNNAADSGAVYIFQGINGGPWVQKAYIKASNTEKSDSFGSALALSSDGSTLGVGAPKEDSSATGLNGVQNDNNSSDSGAAYIFRLSGSTWTQTAYVKASDTHPSAGFGSSLSMSRDGSTLVVGAPIMTNRTYVFAL